MSDFAKATPDKPARVMKLQVVKADGSKEEYLHTKVVGAIANALSSAGQASVKTAEELAEAVTFFLHQIGTNRSVSSNEVFSVIKTVLADTGFEDAAIALERHHFERKLKRCRIEVVKGRPQELTELEKFHENGPEQIKSRWDKSRIVDDLVVEHRLNRQTARAVASMVEEKVFNLGLSLVPVGLIKQLVLSDAAACIRAKQQL